MPKMWMPGSFELKVSILGHFRTIPYRTRVSIVTIFRLSYLNSPSKAD